MFLPIAKLSATAKQNNTLSVLGEKHGRNSITNSLMSRCRPPSFSNTLASFVLHFTGTTGKASTSPGSGQYVLLTRTASIALESLLQTDVCPVAIESTRFSVCTQCKRLLISASSGSVTNICWDQKPKNEYFFQIHEHPPKNPQHATNISKLPERQEHFGPTSTTFVFKLLHSGQWQKWTQPERDTQQSVPQKQICWKFSLGGLTKSAWWWFWVKMVGNFSCKL